MIGGYALDFYNPPDPYRLLEVNSRSGHAHGSLSRRLVKQ